MATDGFSMQRVTLNRLLPPATGEGRDGGDASCDDSPIPARRNGHAIDVIAVEVNLPNPSIGAALQA